MSWPKRLTSLATVIALSGSPAVLSACMALCLQDVPVTAHQHGASAAHAAQAATSSHAHHGAPAASAATALAHPRASAPDSSAARLGATCNNCCPNGVAVVAGPGVERTDAHAFGAAPAVVPVAHFLLAISALGAAPHGAPLSPPAPPRALLVLRI